MSRKVTWRKCASVLIAFVLIFSSIVGMGNQGAEAVARKNISSIRCLQKIMIQSMNT